ncbi:lema family protein [Variovorax sp. JS1663]|uniref:lema family protein n=1 Tax=Variovorax sp. JS1663 TaxID=1851577 RepID=UPI000B343F86|nr:lema family protein [Variovorax sp. JS1663]OUL98098.1 lema family protein [Variovorax sp. JS1663]
MSFVPESWPWWIVGAVVLFWFVGAYNRIVRLRSAALQAYAALDAALVRQLDFVQARSADVPPAQAAVSGHGADASLQASAGQLITLLAATRLKPLDPAGIAALGTALHVMLGAWQRLYPDAVVSFEADGTLSRPAPLGGREELIAGAVPMAWPEPSAAAEIARSQFNQAVHQYNTAIAQFPALLVAWIMQLRPAAPLR